LICKSVTKKFLEKIFWEYHTMVDCSSQVKEFS
jgi:hypothetical protein